MQSSQYVFPLPPIRRLATRSVTFIPASPTSVVSFSLRFAWSRRGVTILDPVGALFARRFHYSGEFDARAADLTSASTQTIRCLPVCRSQQSSGHHTGGWGSQRAPSPRPRKFPQLDRHRVPGGIMSRLTCVVCLVLPIALSGCAGALIVGGLAAAGTGGYAAGQERGIGGAVSDLQIETDV